MIAIPNQVIVFGHRPCLVHCEGMRDKDTEEFHSFTDMFEFSCEKSVNLTPLEEREYLANALRQVFRIAWHQSGSVEQMTQVICEAAETELSKFLEEEASYDNSPKGDIKEFLTKLVESVSRPGKGLPEK